eukprot:CAMPEP_0170547512 /NCGR_PEP_ID=MMETSP0211-20121228/5933_1 /TAXON_ID=311385 /ORGANISM="Pseudokeronopsis sp., Strain OXSARD2" /LENGTH=118 /DNA_ID=CAMNT_0010852619 /DNA_START=1164 /DNA_END=1520 /DNA_ORIENTATION=+
MKQKLYSNAIRLIHHEMDIVRYIRNMRTLEILLKIMLDKPERHLLKSCSKPVIGLHEKQKVTGYYELNEEKRKELINEVMPIEKKRTRKVLKLISGDNVQDEANPSKNELGLLQIDPN